MSFLFIKETSEIYNLKFTFLNSTMITFVYSVLTWVYSFQCYTRHYIKYSKIIFTNIWSFKIYVKFNWDKMEFKLIHVKYTVHIYSLSNLLTYINPEGWQLK